ncbi:MAG: hypothetical protein K9M99_12290 [Candidatus Cloacimonetes bacterium]|nr:hypothetical protein [Candidatus Cloacimonadota bacterium]
MRLIKKTVVLFLTAIFMLTLLTDCAAWHKLKWNEFQLEDAGLSLQIPGKPRHFRMSASSSLVQEEYDQWTVIDEHSNQQFFIIIAKYDQNKYAGFSADDLLDSVERPPIGFLKAAKEISRQRILDKSYLLEEQTWQLEKRTNRALSHIYIYDGRIIELIYMYSIADKVSDAGAVFFDSLVIE